MYRRTAAALLSVLLLLSLCGCRKGKGHPLPEGMEEETVLEAGRDMVKLLNEEKWQEVYDRLRSDGQAACTVEDIRSLMEGIFEKAGEMGRETDAMATGQTLDSGEEYASAVFYYKHAKKDVYYRFAFSTDMELMGFEAAAR